MDLKLKERGFILQALNAFIMDGKQDFNTRDLDWQHVHHLVILYKLIPIFHQVLNKNDVPDDIWSVWQDYMFGTWARYHQALAATIKLFDMFKTHQIEAVALRGISVAHWLYPKPVFRPMGDVDILVDYPDKEQLANMLSRSGIAVKRILRSQVLCEINSISIEIHFSFLTTKRYKHALNDKAWLMNKRLIQLPQGQIYGMDETDELITGICHAFIHHQLDGFLQLVDIGRLITHKNVNWDYLNDWCQSASMTRMIYFTISHVNSIFDLNLEHLPKEVTTHEHKPQRFTAFLAPLFGHDCLTYYFVRKRLLMWVAENPWIKFRQWMRFINYKEWFLIWRLITKGPVQNKGGLEHKGA